MLWHMIVHINEDTHRKDPFKEIEVFNVETFALAQFGIESNHLIIIKSYVSKSSDRKVHSTAKSTLLIIIIIIVKYLQPPVFKP